MLHSNPRTIAKLRRGASVVLLAALQTALLPPTFAQAPTQGDYSLLAAGAPLSEALDLISSHTGISLAYDAELVRGLRAFCDVHDDTVEALLRCVLEGTGLDYHRLSSGTYVIRETARVSSPGSITGRIVDATTGQPVHGANVLVTESRRGTASTAGGRFAVGSLDPGPYHLVVTHVAYHDTEDSVFVVPSANASVAIALSPRTRVVAPIIVNGFRERLPNSSSVHRIAADDLSLLAGGGSVDLLSRGPPVSGVRFGDAMSDVHVQGGATGEHEYRLDGATLFVPLRNGGFIGPFSPFAIRQITIQKAGYGVTHGSHLAGVVEIDQEVGGRSPANVILEVDELAANGRLSGSLGREGGIRANWMIGGRRDLWDVYRPGFVKNAIDDWSRLDVFLVEQLGQTVEPVPDAPTHDVDFWDLHGALRIDFGSRTSARFSRYVGTNRFGTDFDDQSATSRVPADSYRWRNSITGFNIESILSTRAFLEISGWSSYYEMQHPFDIGTTADSCQGCYTPEADDFNDVEEAGAIARLDVAASSSHQLAFGLGGGRTASEMGISIDPYRLRTETGAGHYEIGVWRLFTYLEDRWSVTKATEVRAGTRLTWLGDAQHLYAEPRIAVRYDRALAENGSWALETAAGLYRQFLHQFDAATYGSTALLPTIRFWQPVATEEIPPKAVHLTGSFLLRPDDRLRFMVETFFKASPELREINYVGPRTPEPVSDADLLTKARGRSIGIGLSAERSSRLGTIGLYYDYEWTRRRIRGRYNDSWQPTPWNVPHTFRVAADLKPVDNLSLTCRWRALLGRSWALRQAYYDYLEPNADTRVFGAFDLSDPSSHGLPAYLQLDLGAAYSFDVSDASFQAFVQVLNVFDRANELDGWLDYDEEAGQYRYLPRRWIGRALSIALRIAV